MRQLLEMASPPLLEGGALTTYRVRVVVLQKGLLQRYFWLICSSFFFEFCSLLGPSGEPLSLHLLLNVCVHTAYAGEVTPSQAILSSNSFSEMVPPVLLEEQGQRLSGST